MNDESDTYDLKERHVENLEITAYKNAEGKIEVRVIRNEHGSECVAHLVEDGRIGVSEGSFYLPYMVDELRILENAGIMSGVIGFIREIRDVENEWEENLTYDKIDPESEFPHFQVGNEMPESSFKAMKTEGDGFVGLRVLYGEKWLKSILEYNREKHSEP